MPHTQPTEQQKIFGWEPKPITGSPKVSMVIAAYHRPDPLASLLYSLRSQTYPNWEAVIVHDGAGKSAKQVVEAIQDPRIRFVETTERRGNYGHPWRSYGISLATGDYIGLSNDDNWYAPVYFEWMLSVLTTQQAQFAYCDMVHSHQQWKFYPTQHRRFRLFPTRPKKGTLDLAAWIAEASLVKNTEWTDFSFDGDGTFIEALTAKCAKVLHVPGCLFVHN